MNAEPEPTTAAREVTMTLEEALAYAVQQHQAGDLDRAEPIYEAVLLRHPERVEVLNYLGILKHQRGDLVQAAALMQRLLQLQPAADGVWNNLGNVLMRLDRIAEAGDAFRRSLELVPSAHAWSNLARILRKHGDLAGSERACREALALDPDHGPATHNLALAMILDGRVDPGTEAALRAMQLLPPGQQRRQLYMQLLLLGDAPAQAATVLRAWLVQEPDNPYVQHHLAAVTGEGAPGRASDAYVEKVFDGFAATFDDKLASLHYRAPQVVAQAVASALPRPAGSLAVADIGCGTGLCGPLLRPWAARLVGCDLSGAMLQHARERQVYDELCRAELTAFLRERADAFDLVVSADTLNYFGELREVAQAVHGALRAGGTLVFTLEALAAGEGAPYKLQDHGRYAHDGAHARRVFEAAGLRVDEPVETVLREENKQPVRGWLVVARRQPSSSIVSVLP